MSYIWMRCRKWDPTVANLPIVSLHHVSKSKGLFNKRKLLLANVTASFERGKKYAILGNRESGTDTLLSLIAGTSRPSSGRIFRNGSTTIPLAATAQIAPYKSGRELVYFMARLYRADASETFRFVADFSGLPLSVINGSIGAMAVEERVRFSYALGYGLPADLYLFEGDVQYGNKEFRSRCKSAYLSRSSSAAVVIATSNIKLARSLADRGCVIHGGRLFVFDTITEAIEKYHQVQLGTSSDRVFVHLKTLVQMGETGRAEGYLRDLLEDDSGSADSYATLAEIALTAGRNDEAMQAARASLAKGSDALRPHVIIAKAKEASGDFAGAASYIDSVAQRGHLHPALSMLLASNLDKAGDRRRAGRIWRQIAAATNNDAARRRAQASLVKAEDWAELLELADQALLGSSKDPELLETRALALVGLKRWDDCLHVTRELSSADPLKAISLVYGIARGDNWPVSLNLIRVMPMYALEAVAHQRPAKLLATVLGRHAAAERKIGRSQTAQDIDDVVLRLIPTGIQT